MSPQVRRELAGIGLLLLAIFLGGVLAAQGLHELRYGGEVGSSFGALGTILVLLVSLLGWAGAVWIPLLPAVHALRLFGRMEQRTDRSWLVFLTGLAFLAPVAAGLALHVGAEASRAAGIWGALTSFYMVRGFGTVGAWIVVAMAGCALTAATLAWNPIRVLLHRDAGAAVIAPESVGAEEAAPAKRRRRKKDEDAAVDPAALEPTPEEMPAVDPSLLDADPLAADEAPARDGKKSRRKSKAEASAERDDEIAAAIDARAEPGPGSDELPPTDLLTPPPARNAETGKRELDAMAVKLKDALKTFRVDAEIRDRTTGPVVTQFEVEPAPGVKVRQIANLANDLALAMRAPSIRIVAPIPGRGAVGVEVPNPQPEMVAFREIVESRDFQGARMALPIALGKDLEGKPVVADLAKMPHLLIAGATGSGKSVCVNTIITSLVYRHTPRKLRFLMVDPKMVELSVYNTLPHLRHKVITDNRDAAAVLKWAVMEMQERYELLAANACRNIQDFNQRVQAHLDGQGPAPKLPKRPDVAFEKSTYEGDILPYIVVVIDEMADLMMTVQGEVETPIAMLAQKARAIGIHLILATQRPSVNVITGLIKANFPSRIAFRVASQVDSRTIIDGAGAEALLGNGDMLFIPPGKSEPARLQGAYLPGDDTERLMGWYEGKREERRAALAASGVSPEEADAAGEPDILEAVRAREAAESGGDAEYGEDGRGEDRDKLFREAAEVVINAQQGSTSLLQRRLKIGYGRAARIIDQLHAAGVLGPADGPRPRDVLVGFEELERICGE
ncbi:MAG: cell division protein FtsK [Gemmatimonadaceae bacterium]|nr:cell division protein FtsK [Gemmatimonadaceae bacterium]NUQ94630.1 cell division protein FtsK [Gemmatimonadaceae bacterium]NUS97227.1 cell division protein FtsK [Gemmatimonadaceae bacterium]